MPDERKLSELPDHIGAIEAADLGVLVDDPAGTAATVKAPMSKLRAFVLGIAVAGTAVLAEHTLTLAGQPVLTANQAITVSGDATGTGTTAIALTLATVNANVGTFGSASVVPEITVNAKGLVTGVIARTIAINASQVDAGTLAVARGGTGIGSYTAGNYVRASGASALEQRTPAQVLGDIGAAASGHVHAAADITSGTLGVARGGTGIASYTTGNFLAATGATTLAQRTPAQVLSDIGAAAASHTHDTSALTTGTLATARLGSGTANSTSFLRGDQTWAAIATALSGLTDTTITTPAVGQFLRYSGSAWVNVAIAAGDLPSHNHAASNITSGTLAVARGGTGIASYTVGNFLYASGTTTLAQRTPAQVLADIGAAPSSHFHDTGHLNSGTLQVARGGTGINAYTAGNYIRAVSSSGLEQRTPAQVLGDIAAAAAVHTHTAADITGGTIATARLGSGTASGSTFLRGDQTWASVATTLAALTDTTIGTPNVGEFLRFNGTLWANATIGAGDLPAHTHLASDIVSGTLAVARGGTGLGSYTIGHYLYASGTGTLATRSPADVRADIGASAIGHAHDTGQITSGTFTVARGGTGINAYTAGNYIRAVSSSGLEQRTPTQVRGDIGAAATSHEHSAGDITGGTLAVTHGGTGISVYSVGNFLYANGTSSLAQRTPAQVLSDIGAAPLSHTHAATDIVSGTLAVARGGTGLNAYTSGNYLRAQTSSVLEQRTPAQVRTDIGAAASSHTHSALDITVGTMPTARLGSGTANSTTFLRGDQTWAAVVLALAALSDTGIVAPSEGQFLRFNGGVWANNTLTAGMLPSHTHAATDITSGTLPVARGGTGLASYTVGNFIYASGTTTLAQRTPAQVRADIGAAATSHTHAASDITSGAFASARLSGAYTGITGVGTLTQLLVGSPPAGAEIVRIGGNVRIAGTLFVENWVLI